MFQTVVVMFQTVVVMFQIVVVMFLDIWQFKQKAYGYLFTERQVRKICVQIHSCHI